ncbi:hypothetical protein HMPREF0673_03039 [Leyella stercorea DSM 18206]|uniref:Uncharacterized protein n=1 Tax=Leyella stercorea DSM 18206 TaxID=1002367 RepID=G6B2A5_9BACT|nr:hypothetical protein HMPREF0673_03039 [Leyella stercorea DSM 18206]
MLELKRQPSANQRFGYSVKFQPVYLLFLSLPAVGTACKIHPERKSVRLQEKGNIKQCLTTIKS